MKIEFIPKVGRQGDVVYYKGRTGYIKRQHVQPYDPCTPDQVDNRSNLVLVCERWGALRPAQQEAWRLRAAEKDFMTDSGLLVRLTGYNFFKSLNLRRADLGLAQFELPPAEPIFPPNPVAELVIFNTADTFALKLRVPSQPAQYTLVQASAPLRSGIRCVRHFSFLGLLPPPKGGWSDITELYLTRYGMPKLNTRIWIRTCQHIDGWIDAPKVTQARVLAPAP